MTRANAELHGDTSVASLDRHARPCVSARPYVSVIIPALNEEKAIGFVLDDLPREWVDQVIVVDNGSTDATAEVAGSRGALVLSHNERGYGAACLAGLENLPPKTQVVAFLDGDYSDFPEEISKLLAPICEGRADMVIGTRTVVPLARNVLTPQQRWGNWLATTLIRLRFGRHFTDLGPFRAIRKEALCRLDMADRNFGWTVEMQIKAVLAGLTILEVPVRYRPRIGSSKVSGTVRGALLAGIKIIYTICRYSLSAGRVYR
jgi:glycosyltransferase involved in cell wall biosynthesis